MGGNERGKRKSWRRGPAQLLRPRGGGAQPGKEGMVLGSHGLGGESEERQFLARRKKSGGHGHSVTVIIKVGWD